MTREHSGTPGERQPRTAQPQIQTIDDLDACADCPAIVTATVGVSPVTSRRVVVATFIHAVSCPWMNAVAPSGASFVRAHDGAHVVVHIRDDR